MSSPSLDDHWVKSCINNAWGISRFLASRMSPGVSGYPELSMCVICEVGLMRQLGQDWQLDSFWYPSVFRYFQASKIFS